MTSPDISPLLTPFTIRQTEIPTRFVLPPIERGLGREGAPRPELGEFYAERVRNGTGLIITEVTGIDHPVAVPTSQVKALSLREDTHDAWARTIDAVHDAGGKIAPQLWHAGSFRESDHLDSLSPTGLIAPGVRNGRAATRDELDEIREAYVRSAVIAQRAGADGVEIHGAHSYLLDQFLWEETNDRTDGYGGPDIRDRVRFPAEVVAAVREALSPEMFVSFRFSQYKPLDFRARVVADEGELAVMLSVLSDAGVDVFHASALHVEAPAFAGSDKTIAAWTSELATQPVIGVGSVGLDIDVWGSFGPVALSNTGPEQIRDLLARFEAGEFDLISVGRAVVADADWIPKVREGRYDDIRPFDARIDIAEIDVHTFLIDEIVGAYAQYAAGQRG